MQTRPRPKGVTLLAVLSTISGIFSLILGGLLLVAGELLVSMLLVSSGIAGFFLAIGYLDGSERAWILGIVFGIINTVGLIVEAAFGLTSNTLGIIFSVITILYLTRPSVRAFFGRGRRPLMIQGRQSDQSVLPMATNSPPKMSSIVRSCLKCGAMIPPEAGFCRSCGAVQ